MTTMLDTGDNPIPMLACPPRAQNLYPPLVLAMRDMRQANGRDPTTGDGPPNPSWTAFTLSMVVLDSLSGPRDQPVRQRWIRLLTSHRILETDAAIIYEVRCALLHGYGLPASDRLHDRRIILTDDRRSFALQTDDPDGVVLSVPVFCGKLVERIVSEASSDWDVSEIDADYPYPGPSIRLLGVTATSQSVSLGPD